MNPPPRELHLILDNIRSAFNVGSIFRTADAAGVAHLHLCGMTPTPPNLKLARAALGAEQGLAWTQHTDAARAVAELAARGFAVVALETVASAPLYTDFAWPARTALVLGHEVRGIRPDALELCTAAVQIPMRGHKNSLNVATAAGIAVFEILRQWEKG